MLSQGWNRVCWTGLLLIAAQGAYAGLPVDYNQGYIAHQVRIPKLSITGAPGTDLSQKPWSEAAVLTGNLDWRRIRTANAPIWTYLFYDQNAVWVAYRSEATPGPQVKGEARERDSELKKDTSFTLEFDVGRTGRVFYRFVINAAGSLCDSVIIDKSWNSTATIQTAKDDKGWTAVVGIPFADFKIGEPPVDSASWTFNISDRSANDNSWAPVLGGYHIPEQFATIVFGGEQTRPARMRAFKSLHAGPNAFEVQAPAGSRYLLEAVDRQNRVVARPQGPVGSDGRISFDLLQDDIDHVNIRINDPDDHTLVSFWRPAEIPPLISKLAGLSDKLAFVKKSLEQFPPKPRENAAKLIGEAESLIGTPTASIYADWDRLYKRLEKLERPLTDAWLYAQTLTRVSPKAQFAIALASPMDKVMIKDFPCQGEALKSYELGLARNEREAVQVVVIPADRDLEAVKVEASPAVSTQGQGKLDGQVAVGLVGHVKTVPAGSYEPDYVGWYPDPILGFQQSCKVAVGEHVAFWVDVAAGKNARPGEYASTLTISAADCPPAEVQLKIRVWDLELSDGTHLRTAFTYTEASTKRLYKNSWSDQLARKYQDFLLDHRLNVDSLYGKNKLDINMLKHAASRGMNAFNLFYVGKGSSAEVVQKLLEEGVPALKEAGLYKLAYLYGFDEVNDEVFPRIKDVFGMVGKLYPDLPRMTTGYDNTFGRKTGLGDYVDIWVPLIPEYNMVEADRLREQGNDMWWYLCVGPRHPYPNWFVESPAIETRLLMGAMSYKYRAGGVLYFMTNQWGHNDKPISSGPYTDWWPGSGKGTGQDGAYANGDGSIFCPGPDGPMTTIRMENIRDGLEDYEYLYELARVVENVAKQPASLQSAAFQQRARQLLTVPDDVVESSSRYTYDARRVYAFRQQVANAIVEGRTLGGAGSEPSSKN